MSGYWQALERAAHGGAADAEPRRPALFEGGGSLDIEFVEQDSPLDPVAAAAVRPSDAAADAPEPAELPRRTEPPKAGEPTVVPEQRTARPVGPESGPEPARAREPVGTAAVPPDPARNEAVPASGHPEPAHVQERAVEWVERVETVETHHHHEARLVETLQPLFAGESATPEPASPREFPTVIATPAAAPVTLLEPAVVPPPAGAQDLLEPPYTLVQIDRIEIRLDPPAPAPPVPAPERRRGPEPVLSLEAYLSDRGGGR